MKKPWGFHINCSKSLTLIWQARNFLRAMKLGQQAFFYHSNCKEPGIVGIVKVSASFCVSGRKKGISGLSNSLLALLLFHNQRSAKGSLIRAANRPRVSRLTVCIVVSIFGIFPQRNETTSLLPCCHFRASPAMQNIALHSWFLIDI